MRLVDKVTCVHCGDTKFQRSTGKSSRSFLGECEPSCEEKPHGIPAKDEQTGKPKVVPAR